MSIKDNLLEIFNENATKDDKYICDCSESEDISKCNIKNKGKSCCTFFLYKNIYKIVLII